MKKVFGIVGVCLALLISASLGCGGHEDTDDMDTKVGVSALAAFLFGVWVAATFLHACPICRVFGASRSMQA